MSKRKDGETKSGEETEVKAICIGNLATGSGASVENGVIKDLKVAICGCTTSYKLAPFNNPDWEIWGVNNLYPFLPRKTAWFEIHPIKFENGIYYRRDLIAPGKFVWSDKFRGQPVEEYLRGLGELGIPVYMQQHWDIVPNSVVFPLKEITDRFGRYFTNTISYEIALAIHLGAKEIAVYGVDMAVDTEYHHQRPSCEYFLGIAEGMGIKVHVPDEADLLKTIFLYGFEEQEADHWDKKLREMQVSITEKLNKTQQILTVEQRKAEQYIGAQAALKEVAKIRR